MNSLYVLEIKIKHSCKKLNRKMLKLIWNMLKKRGCNVFVVYILPNYYSIIIKWWGNYSFIVKL